MGVYVHLAVSRSVTQDEWTKVYEESLVMADAFGLADFKEIAIHGARVACLVKTREEEMRFSSGAPELAWRACGDYNYRIACEDNVLPRFLDEEPDAAAPDPVLLLNRSEESGERDGGYVSYWTGKTQGGPQHMALLAIGCMMESRLKGKAFVYGDITRGQCREATRLANGVLDRKIQEPDQCDLRRFFDRVSRLPAEDVEKLDVLMRQYLGERDAVFGDFLRAHFSAGVLRAWWKKRIGMFRVGTIGYNDMYREYMAEGFGLRELCQDTIFNGDDGKDLTEEFIRTILDSGLYVSQKDCRDRIRPDDDDPAPYGVMTQMAQVFFAGYHNLNVNRYIPLDDIRTILGEEIGERCDVAEVIDRYFDDESRSERKDAISLMADTLDKITEEHRESTTGYDIYDCANLLFYTKGDTVAPAVARSAVVVHEYCQKIAREHADLVEKMAGMEPEEILQRLARRSYDVTLRDSDWRKIYDDLVRVPDSYKRYLTAICVKSNDDNANSVVKAYIVNDAFYDDLCQGRLRAPQSDES